MSLKKPKYDPATFNGDKKRNKLLQQGSLEDCDRTAKEWMKKNIEVNLQFNKELSTFIENK